MARFIVSSTLSFPEMPSCSLISKLNSSNFDCVTSMSLKLKFITLIKSVVSPCASLLACLNTRRLVRFVPVSLKYFSHHLSRSLCRQQCQDIVERRAFSFPASSVGVRFTLGSAATACSSFSSVPSIVPTKHVSAKSQSLYSVFSTTEGCRLVQPRDFVRHRHCLDGSDCRLTPERLVLCGQSLDRLSQSFRLFLEACQHLFWRHHRSGCSPSSRVHGFTRASNSLSQHEGVLNSAPPPRKVRQVSRVLRPLLWQSV